MGQQYGWLEYKTKCTGKVTVSKENFIGSNFLDPNSARSNDMS